MILKYKDVEYIGIEYFKYLIKSDKENIYYQILTNSGHKITFLTSQTKEINFLPNQYLNLSSLTSLGIGNYSTNERAQTSFIGDLNTVKKLPDTYELWDHAILEEDCILL